MSVNEQSTVGAGAADTTHLITTTTPPLTLTTHFDVTEEHHHSDGTVTPDTSCDAGTAPITVTVPAKSGLRGVGITLNSE